MLKKHLGFESAKTAQKNLRPKVETFWNDLSDSNIIMSYINKPRNSVFKMTWI